MRGALRVACVVALAILATTAPAATAQVWISSGDTIIIFGDIPTTARLVSTRSVALGVSGQITVRFASDQRSGCRALAACGYHGTIVWMPGRGQVVFERYILRGQHHVLSLLDLGGSPDAPSTSTYARVVRELPGGGTAVCADGASAAVSIATGRAAGRGFRFALTGQMTATRCAGPMPADVATRLPSLVLPAHPTRGERIEAIGERSFAAHGFTGTVISTLVVTVGTSTTQGPATTPSGLHWQRIRMARESVRLVGVRGALTEDVRGTTAANVCVLLDSCGLNGTLTLTPVAGPTDSGEVTVYGGATTPYLDLLAALGRRPARHIGALQGAGQVVWADRGTLRAQLHQAATCSDTVPLQYGSVSLLVSGARIHAHYAPGGGIGGRTRCPGPELWTVQPSLSGTIPVSAVRAGTFTVTVRPAGRFGDDGYTVVPRGQIAFTFKLGRVKTSVIRVPRP